MPSCWPQRSATALDGATVNAVPRQTLSLWNRYDLSDRIGGGVGLIRRSDMSASTSNAVVLPGFTRIDAALFETIHPGCTAQLNIENPGRPETRLRQPMAITISRPVRRAPSVPICI
jgi:outer membrane receptor for monomeric catechols